MKVSIITSFLLVLLVIISIFAIRDMINNGRTLEAKIITITVVYVLIIYAWIVNTSRFDYLDNIK